MSRFARGVALVLAGLGISVVTGCGDIGDARVKAPLDLEPDGEHATWSWTLSCGSDRVDQGTGGKCDFVPG